MQISQGKQIMASRYADKKPFKTPANFNKKSWLISRVRQATKYYPPAREANDRDKQIYFIPSKTGKPMYRVKFECAACGKKDLKRGDVEQDHIIPLVGPEGFVDWNTFFDRYLCDVGNFQYLCEPCHDEKTLKEGQARTKRRKKRVAKKTKRS